MNFKFSLSKSFEEKGGVVVDKYNETFTNENMDKVNQLDDLRYMTKKPYPYYRIHNIGTGAFLQVSFLQEIRIITILEILQKMQKNEP